MTCYPHTSSKTEIVVLRCSPSNLSVSMELRQWPIGHIFRRVKHEYQKTPRIDTFFISNTLICRNICGHVVKGADNRQAVSQKKERMHLRRGSDVWQIASPGWGAFINEICRKLWFWTLYACIESLLCRSNDMQYRSVGCDSNRCY